MPLLMLTGQLNSYWSKAIGHREARARLRDSNKKACCD